MQRHHPRPLILTAGQPAIQRRQQLLPPGQQRQPRRQPQHQAPARAPSGRWPRLASSAADPGAQPLDQAPQVAELGRADLAGDLGPERPHQRRPLRVLHIGQAHVGDAGPHQRDPRNTGLTRPAELQLGDRQALRVVLRRLEPIPVPQDQHIQVTGVHIIQAALPHRVAVGPVTVHHLMLRRHQPVHDLPAFLLQVGDRGRHIDPGHHPPAPGPPSPAALTIARPNPAYHPDHAAAPASSSGASPGSCPLVPGRYRTRQYTARLGRLDHHDRATGAVGSQQSPASGHTGPVQAFDLPT